MRARVAGRSLVFSTVRSAEPFASASTHESHALLAGELCTFSCEAPLPASELFQLPASSGMAENFADPCGAITSCARSSMSCTEFASLTAARYAAPSPGCLSVPYPTCHRPAECRFPPELHAPG